jgi:ABC-type Fe3+-hydroxamate transport system substrate-binding protein
LNVLTVSDHTIQDVYAGMTALGRATHHEAGAAKLIAATREGLSQVSKKTAGIRPDARPSVVLIVDRTPGTLRDLYMATAGGYLAELVEMAGGRIAAPPAKTGYQKLSKEDLLAINPQIILDFIHGVQSRFSGDPLEAWSEMPELKAVRTRRVYGVNEDFVPHASQRMVQTAELFAHLIHPEVK